MNYFFPVTASSSAQYSFPSVGHKHGRQIPWVQWLFMVERAVNPVSNPSLIARDFLCPSVCDVSGLK